MIKLMQILTVATNNVDAYVCLTMLQRTKSRLKVQLEDGRDAGLFLPRGQLLEHGTQLTSDDDFVVEVIAAKERVSTAHCDDPTLFARGCYHLGNRHVPLQVEAGWCRFLHDHVLDDMLVGLGLQVTVEDAAFQPEPGAYGGTTGGHSHGSEEEYVHPHDSANEH